MLITNPQTFLCLLVSFSIVLFDNESAAAVTQAQSGKPYFQISEPGSPTHLAHDSTSEDHGDTDQDVPPEVLQAIYPQRHDEKRKAHGHPDYFDSADQFTELELGSTDAAQSTARPSRFNDTLMESMNLGRTTDQPDSIDSANARRIQPQLHAQQNNESRPKTEIHNVPDQFQNENYIGQDVSPASHTAPLDPRHRTQPDFELSNNSVTSRFDSRSPLIDTEQQIPRIDPQSNVENYSGATLAELLAESDRDRRNNRSRNPEGSLNNEPEPWLNSNPANNETISAKSTPTTSLTETIQRVSLGLCIVLGLACGILLIAKRWFTGPKLARAIKADQSQPVVASTIKLLTQLRLDTKSHLYLVQANDQQVLVAVDVGGIKSVVPLHSDFPTTLDEIAEPAPPGAKSIVQQLEEELDENGVDAGTYTAAMLQSSRTSPTRKTQGLARQTATTHKEPRTDEVETEMKRRLAELLRGSLVNKQI